MEIASSAPAIMTRGWRNRLNCPAAIIMTNDVKPPGINESPARVAV